MQPSFLLDTSAFRALPTCRLEAASRSASLYVSPFCFWELLTHLKDDQKFHRVKGNLLKFRHVAFLDDPHAEVYRLGLPASDNMYTRVHDGDLIYAALAALNDSESTREFYERFIQDESGNIHQIAGCVARVQETLLNKEQRFQRFLRAIVVALRAEQIRLIADAQGVQDLSLGWWLQIHHRTDEAPGVYEQFVRKTYIYHSYMLHRACEYAARNTDSIDPNDFEDARLCLHLGFDDFTAVVTNDADLRLCLESSLGALNSMADASRHTQLQVWDTTAFTEH